MAFTFIVLIQKTNFYVTRAKQKATTWKQPTGQKTGAKKDHVHNS